MTAPRVPLTRIEKEQRRPQASPVDAMIVAPRTGASAARLSSALGSISQPMLELGLQLQQKRDEDAFKEGEKFARELAAAGVKFRDAIRDGRITADQSPFFRMGAEEQLGRITADRYNAALQHAMLTAPELRASTDPEDFDRFVGGFRDAFLQENAPDASKFFEQGFGPRAQAHTNQARFAFASRAGGLLIENVKEQTYQEFRNAMRMELVAGEDPAEALQITIMRQMAIGLTGREANNILTAAVIDEAEARDDLSLLNVLGRIPAGPGSTVAERRETVEAVNQAKERIVRRRQSERNAEWQLLAHERSEAARNARVFLTTEFMEGRDALDKAIEMDPTNSDALTAQYNALQEARVGSDRSYVQEILADIHRVGDPNSDEFVTVDTLVGALTSRTDRRIDQADFSFLRQQLDNRDEKIRKAREGGLDPYRNPIYQDATRELDDFFGVNPITGKFNTPVVAERARRAQARLADAWLDYVTSDEGRTATARQQNEWLFQAVEETGRTFADPKDLDKVDRAALPEFQTVPPYVNNVMITRDQFEALQSELATGGSLDTLSEAALDLLIRAGVASVEDLQTFMERQGALLNLRR